MGNNVFIPSRGRWEGAQKLTNIWYQNRFDVHWVVEPDEKDQYIKAIEPEPGLVHALPIKNAGIAFSRNHCVNIAASYGYKSIILADDDIKPGKNANMDIILEDAEDPKVLGITARYSYHDFALGPKIKGRYDLILQPTGMFRLVALNVENVENLLNYDHTLEYAEDCDLFLRGLQAGYPWMVHLGTYANSIGTRYQPGGILDFAVKTTLCHEIPEGQNVLEYKKAKWHNDIHHKYPNIVNKHTERCKDKQNCIRIGWQRAYDRYMPGWRKYSFLHGGDIELYFDGA